MARRLIVAGASPVARRRAGGYDFLAYFLLNRSMRPAVSSSFCLPVKNGWQFEQMSTPKSPRVENVSWTVPHAQVMLVRQLLQSKIDKVARSGLAGRQHILVEAREGRVGSGLALHQAPRRLILAFGRRQGDGGGLLTLLRAPHSDPQRVHHPNKKDDVDRQPGGHRND